MKQFFTLFFTAIICLNIQAQTISEHFVKLNYSGNVVRQLNPIDSSIVWGLAYVQTNDLAYKSNPVEVIRSTNSGVSWKAHPVPNTSFNDSLTLQSFWPVTDQKCFVGFWNHIKNGGGKVLRTADGGATWQTVNFGNNAFVGGFFNFIYFFSPDSGIAVGDPNSGSFEIYTTSDGGFNWSKVLANNIANPMNGEFGTSNYFSYSKDSFYFKTSQNRLYVTGNRGLTWSAGNQLFGLGNERFLINDFYAGLRTIDNKTYQYSSDVFKTGNIVVFPDTASLTFGSPLRTKSDNYFFIVAKDTIGRRTLFDCPSPNTTNQWQKRITNNTRPFALDNTYNNYFYSKDLGWLVSDSVPKGDTIQPIYRFARCQQKSIPTYIYSVCNQNENLDLRTLFYDTTGSVFYVWNTSPVTFDTVASVPTSSLPYPDFKIWYNYVDSTGCLSQRSRVFTHANADNPIATLTFPVDTLCTSSAPVSMSGGSPLGGNYRIEGLNRPTFNPSLYPANKTYDVSYTIVDSNNCFSIAYDSVYVAICSGIDETPLAESFSLFPNPSTGLLNITGDIEWKDVKIMNLNGSVLQTISNEENGWIDLRNYTAGVYLIEINSETFKSIQRLVLTQ